MKIQTPTKVYSRFEPELDLANRTMDEFRLHIALQRQDKPLPSHLSEKPVTLAKRKINDSDLDALAEGVCLT